MPCWLNFSTVFPTAQVEVATAGGTEKFKAQARPIESGPERDRLYKEMTKIWPAFADYQTRTERVIPVVVLKRRR